ncbi:MAG: 5-methyltetrahydropteroyltriglutamate--homocysteine S-methyltransferase, partial [Rhodospirillaceae bacterium]|nr:5-methyltetrahydropteroyltriglutamate--homocysteine S-methyltransferase [Rhodospirillaceae bacterium]
MTGSNSARPPFRVEHVGSFVRPGRLLEAARANKAGKLGDRAYLDVQNDCIAEIVA